VTIHRLRVDDKRERCFSYSNVPPLMAAERIGFDRLRRSAQSVHARRRDAKAASAADQAP